MYTYVVVQLLTISYSRPAYLITPFIPCKEVDTLKDAPLEHVPPLSMLSTE